MKKNVPLVVILLLLSFSGQACDACGAAAAGNGIGLLNNFRNNIVGFRYSHVPFESSVRSEGNSVDYFHAFELHARYQLVPRFRLSAQLPYRNSVRKTNGKDLNLDGLSDVKIMAVYALFDNLQLGDQSNFYWEFGSGVKLPTGEYDGTLTDQDLPDNFNLGNGAWGWLAQTNAVYSQKGFGLSFSANVQLNGESSDGYHFGHQFSGAMVFFGDLALSEKIKLVPFVGLSAEKILRDEHANGNQAHSTGGEGVFATGGVNFRFDRWQLGANLAQPLEQNYSDREVEARLRTSVELNYFF